MNYKTHKTTQHSKEKDSKKHKKTVKNKNTCTLHNIDRQTDNTMNARRQLYTLHIYFIPYLIYLIIFHFEQLQHSKQPMESDSQLPAYDLKPSKAQIPLGPVSP